MLNTLLAMTGNDNTITIHRAVVDFLGGDYETAALLEQLLYWTSRSVMGGWISKSDKEFKNEIYFTRHTMRRTRNKLKALGLLETKVKRWNNIPTTHYRINLLALSELWKSFISEGMGENEQSERAKTNNRLGENEQSLTETTNRDYLTETTKTLTNGQKDKTPIRVGV